MAILACPQCPRATRALKGAKDLTKELSRTRDKQIAATPSGRYDQEKHTHLPHWCARVGSDHRFTRQLPVCGRRRAVTFTTERRDLLKGRIAP
jgi:hypothetical protein